VAITLWRDEYAIVTALDHFGEVRIELHECATARELGTAEILEPDLRTLHAIERASRSVGKWHHSALQTHRLEIADNADVAKKATRNGAGLLVMPTMPGPLLE